MDATHFDALARSLTIAGSRRGALTGLLLGSLGLLSVSDAQDVAAKNCKKIKDKKKRKKCLAKASDTTTPDPVSPPPDPCASCTGDEVCTDGQCLVPACGAGGPCLVFLSSILYQGNLGGLSGADAKCQSLARAAALPGTYRAWLSDSTSSPDSRFVRSTGPYRLVNGTQIASSWTGLTDGTLAAPIDVTETGGSYGNNIFVWTHTRTNGGRKLTNDNCGNWSTASGTGRGDRGWCQTAKSVWTDDDFSFCNNTHHLYCLQQR